MLKKAQAEDFEIVFYENNEKTVKRPAVKSFQQADSLNSLTTSRSVMIKPIGTRNNLRTMHKEFNQLTEFIHQVFSEQPLPSTGLTLTSSMNGVNLGAESVGNNQMRELLNRYLQKDRMLYNQIQTSASVTPVPESVSAKSSVLRGYTEHLEKSLNQLLIEDIQANELLEQTQEQEERAAIPITHQQIVESHQSKQNLDLFEIKEDPTSARSSLARETVNKENNNILQNQELALDEVQEVIDAEYQESDMSHSRSHRQPYVIAEKKSTSRLWRQAFEQPSRISVKDVKFLKPSRSNNPYDVSRRTTSNPASRDASPIFKGDRDGSFTISKPIIKEIPKPELQMDQSMRIVGKPARNVYELSPISTQRKLGEIWTQDGVKSAESFYSPANVSKMYDKTRKGGKSPTTANTSTISINNCTRNPTNYSFRANEANASKKNQVVGDASKRFKLPNESKPKVKAFAAHHEKERLKESLKQLKHSLMLES